MPLVVPVLRLFMLFLNVYETFKTLKIPPSSARRGGKPSVRAMTQRKRDLKGCLAIWVVWCCFSAYEKTFDGIIGLITPFYSEIKSVAMLFLLLTRARGAEPLFLHVIRPLVKPYTATLDSLLELVGMIGDFLFALLQVPIEFALSWWPSLFWHCRTSESSETPTSRTSSDASLDTSTSKQAIVEAPVKSPAPSKRPISVRSVSDNRRPSRGRQASSGSSIRSTLPERRTKSVFVASNPNHSKASLGNRSTRSSFASSSRQDKYEIWYPPAPAREVPNTEDHVPLEMPIPSTPAAVLPNTSLLWPSPISDTTTPLAVEDWRVYPAFPSAYPPTPLPVSTTLPMRASNPVQSTEKVLPLSQGPSDAVQYPPTVDEAIPHDRADSPLPLEQPVDSSSSSSNSNSEGDINIQHMGEKQTQNEEMNHSMTEASDEDGSQGGSESADAADDDDDNDEFDITLQTPYHANPSSEGRIYNDSDEYNESEGIVSSGSESGGSSPSRSTTLTTADNASSLRTRTSSESTNSMFHTSDSSLSMTGRKRSYPVIDVRTRAMTFQHAGSSTASKNSTIRGKPLTTVPYRKGSGPLTSETVGDDDGFESSEGGADSKRRKFARPATSANPRQRPTSKIVPVTTRHSTTAAKRTSIVVRGKAAVNTQTRTRSSSRIANSRFTSAPRRGTIISRPARGEGGDTTSDNVEAPIRGKIPRMKP